MQLRAVVTRLRLQLQHEAPLPTLGQRVIVAHGVTLTTVVVQVAGNVPLVCSARCQHQYTALHQLGTAKHLRRQNHVSPVRDGNLINNDQSTDYFSAQRMYFDKLDYPKRSMLPFY